MPLVKKKYILRFRAVNQDIFNAIKNGKKKVETRAATARYNKIKVGDVIILVCGKNKFKKTVKRARIFKTIRSMLEKYKVKDIMPNLLSAKELERAYYGYPNYRQKIKKFGLIALELK
ncbi:MAG: hypothetical protein Q7K65_02200 [Candidatus Buchananbacteria bacterium]|nr:hypothetical protein [Candidatus Buchananbacteria bacterium]